MEWREISAVRDGQTHLGYFVIDERAVRVRLGRVERSAAINATPPLWLAQLLLEELVSLAEPPKT